MWTFAEATSELTETRRRLNDAELALQAVREREQLTAPTYRALAERARQELVACPRCRKPVHGSDLLVSGRCPHCNKALTSLLLPTRTADPSKTNTSRRWARSAFSSAWRSPPPIRTQPDRHAAAPAHAYTM